MILLLNEELTGTTDWGKDLSHSLITATIKPIC